MESRIRDEISEHPELGDEDSRNGGSTAPTTTAGTPVPTKIKLTLKNSQYANGGSSGVQSDDD